jgi:hypothetical protein
VINLVICSIRSQGNVLYLGCVNVVA